MNASNGGVLKELYDNKADVPEGIGVAEDSGFASIAGSIAGKIIHEKKNETEKFSM